MRTRKPALTRFTNEDLRRFDPCYDPIRYFKDSQTLTVLDILHHKECPSEDKFWAFTRNGLLSDKVLRLFAVACAKTSRKYATDKTTFDATLRVATRFANGQATEEELGVARSAAYSAAYSAASSAASYAAYAASDAARSAASSAASYAASYAAYAASDAARSAASSAARSAASSAARSAASSAASSAAYSRMIRSLVKLIESEYSKP